MGTALIIGKPLDSIDFVERFQLIHDGAYKKYSKMKTEVLIEVVPQRVKKWEYVNETPYLKEIDFMKKIAFIEQYTIE